MNLADFKAAIVQGIPDKLPLPKPYETKINHAPKRKDILSDKEKKLALKNALRYFPNEFHAVLAPEFLNELTQFGRIYMYRFRPNYKIYAHPINEYTAKSKQAASIMLMIQKPLRYFIFQVCFLSVMLMHGQSQTDSLKNLLANTSDKLEKADIMLEIGEALLDATPEIAMQYYQNSKVLAEELQDTSIIFSCLLGICDVHSIFQENKDALHLIYEALELAKNDYELAIKSKLNEGSTFTFSIPEAPKH